MHSPLRALALVLVLASALALPASAQPKRCVGEILTVDGTAICATFTADAPGAGSVTVHESFTAAGKATGRTFSFELLAGAASSRAIHDADISELVPGRTLHMSLRYSGGSVTLEHAQLLPGGKPLK